MNNSAETNFYYGMGTCAICGGEYTRGGNNPYPVIKDGISRCCNRCDIDIVIPIRKIDMWDIGIDFEQKKIKVLQVIEDYLEDEKLWFMSDPLPIDTRTPFDNDSSE